MEGAGQQQAADEEHKVLSKGLILHSSDDFKQKLDPEKDQERKFVGLVKGELRNQGIDLEALNWTPDAGVSDPEHVKKLEDVQECLNSHERVIIAFPGSFGMAQLVQAVNMIVKRQRAYVVVIMYTNHYDKMPDELKEFNIQRIMFNKNMQAMDGIIEELKSFIKDDPKKLDLPFLNFGNGLAWSYYFGYLVKMLPDMEKIIMESEWRKGAGKDAPNDHILKRMLIYPKLEIMKKDLTKPSEGGRLIFHKNEVQENRAGIDRKYEIDIREVKSKDLTETYYGIADYANCLRMLVRLRDDRNMSIFDMSEEMMVKQGRYFHARLGLFLYGGSMKKYNKKKNIDPSKFELQPFDTTPRSAPEDQLVENLFQKMKEACQAEPPVGLREDLRQDTGTVCLPHSEGIIKKLENVLPQGGSTRDLWSLGQELDATLCQLKKVFIVLTDELVTSQKFEDLFYTILRHGYEVNNRRFLVCLDCLTGATSNHPALQLLLLFKCISYGPEWESKVKTELEGDCQEITYDLMFHNVGAGFALSYYYGYLNFRIPGMKDIVEKTSKLKEKFIDGSLSYKLFVLHPHTCKVQAKVSDADPDFIKDRDDDAELKNITFGDITNDRRIYTPKMSSIVDPITKKKYFVFVEYNTQAETLHRMMKEGFLDNAKLLEEWDRFCNLLHRILSQGGPIMSGKRLQIIRYDDKNETSGYLAQTILDRVIPEIENEREEAKNMSEGE